jgi:hypothetical protein
MGQGRAAGKLLRQQHLLHAFLQGLQGLLLMMVSAART